MSLQSDAPLLDPPSTETGPIPDLLLSLPDEPTLAIFSLLPLQQLIVNVPLVHRRLAPIRENVLTGTQRLAIYIGDSTGEHLCPDPNWSELNQLHLASLDYRAVGQLSSLMPAIVHLQVIISHAPISVLPQLAILLSHWAPTLKTLKLNIGPLYFNERLGLMGEPLCILTSNVRLLLQAINRKFVALQHLTLDIGKLIDDAQFANEFFVGGKTGDPLNLSILGQLKEFYLHLGKGAYGKGFFLLEARKKYFPEKLTSIGLNCVRFENDLANSSSSSTRTALKPESERVLKGTQILVLHIGDQKEIKRRQFNSPLRFPFASHLVDSTGALLYPQTDFPTLHLATLDDQSVKQLSSLMPDILHLQVVIVDAPISVFLQLGYLLARWAPTLQDLSLTISGLTFGTINYCAIVGIFRRFFESINEDLEALQHLTLDLGKDLFRNSDKFLTDGRTGIPFCLPILGQLREFYLNMDICPSAPNFLFDQLTQYATEKLTHIGVGGDFEWNWNQVANSQFAGRFTIVPFNNPPTSNHALFRSFSSLTVYGFDWKQLNALDLVAHLRVLSTLSQLQCLKVDSFSPVSHSLPSSFPDLPPLRSVTVLEMSIDLKVSEHHSHLQAPYWKALFPAVQIVKVTHAGKFCAICYRGDGRFARLKTNDYAQVTPCLCQLFAPLRVLPSLRKIFYQRGANQSDCIAEFTPQGEFVRTYEFIG